ncbi:4-(cytidine 5'-diphospho)-2-C-methyl-D-erythritol kinase [Nocardioides euryhalodurans]|uniref:4-diphosphocytidyl-2-C-methyl-D-erythritol kinase n=1 Tax=Nocardioides euryhalodurans TaxID=2518370 RepID=A0A4P7GRB2_9ACTN|nr:4-(cytidine 5'-diphospho)-2-C-methyl-D-erythritol kinase [Nocardioides euryhalodurans]
MTVRAAAKVNLHLGVGAPRPDGFHPLDTVYQAVSLYDDVRVRPAGSWSLDLTAAAHVAATDVPLDGRNIVTRAADLLGVEAEVSIHKEIPAAGGMAGGSADAAAALVALDRLHDLQTSDARLLELAAELGSDVPFALVGGTARGTGRGEQVAPVDDAGSWWWVVVPSGTGLSTPEVYARFDALRPDAAAEPASPDRLLAALASGEPAALAAALRNDLEPAALDLRPELRDVLEAGEAAGALRGLVSGSGPTCVFLCSDGPGAREVAVALRSAYDVVLTAHGPVAGAHVMTEAG